MKFRSLLFQEFRISRKTILLQAGLLLMWIAMSWVMVFSVGSEGFTEEELGRIVDAVSLATALVGVMYLLVDETFKSNVDSGWLNYSYALPIRPLERTAARFVRQFSVTFASVLLSLCNVAALCARPGKPFGANYIVWHLVILAAVILNTLPNNMILLRARSGADMKKKQSTAGLATMALMVVLVIVIYKASGMSLDTLADSDTVINLSVFTAGSLAWAVPLLLAMMAASFFATYHSLRSAHSGTVKSEKESAEVNPQAALAEKADGVKGLLYKELRQNRLILILTAAAPILLTAYPFCFAAIGVMTGDTKIDGLFETATDSIIRILMWAVGIFVASGLMSEVFRGDDKKLWAYFIVSTPQGVKGFLYRKYVMTLMLNLIYMVSWILADSLLATLNYFVTGEELMANMQMLYLVGVYLLLSVSALDIPFMVRYGSKKGSIIKMISMLSLCTAGVAVFSILPRDVQDKLMEIATSVIDGEANEVLLLTLSLLPYLVFAAFLFSYRVACRVFMKGVNEYDK